MKKALYILLLSAEVFLGFFAVCLMFSWGFGVVSVATLLLAGVCLTALIRRMKRQKQENLPTAQRKTGCLIALVLLLPILPAVYVIIQIAMALAIYG